jgi:hypothetical protein
MRKSQFIMKYLFFVFLLSLALVTYSQSSKQKVSKDSIRYYRTELNKLTRATYDSMINSEKYKQLQGKLNPDGKKANENFGVELTVFAGVQVNDITNLNARLKLLKIEEKKTLMGNVGIGLAFRFNKVVIGYDMTPIMGGDKSTGGYIHGYLSTNTIKSKKWIFSPQIGLGGQGITTRITTPSSSTNFNSYFTSSANQVEINHSTTLVDLAVVFKRYNDKTGRHIPLLRIGYRYGLKDETWTVESGYSTDAPSDRLSNYYFQLQIGFGD